jgi:ribosomal protein S18 acetylase RimI-like enzyme
MIRLAVAQNDFDKWSELLELLQQSYAYMEGKIAPPSSLQSYSAEKLAEKSTGEELILAWSGQVLVGCVFGKQTDDGMYIGKAAVNPNYQGQGIGRQLMQAIENEAMSSGLSRLWLEVRIELTELHETYGALGYSAISEGCHEGFEQTTFLTMEKQLLP